MVWTRWSHSLRLWPEDTPARRAGSREGGGEQQESLPGPARPSAGTHRHVARCRPLPQEFARPGARDGGDLREGLWAWGRRQAFLARARPWAEAFVRPAASALWGAKLIWGVPRRPLSCGAPQGSAVSPPGTCSLHPGPVSSAATPGGRARPRRLLTAPEQVREVARTARQRWPGRHRDPRQHPASTWPARSSQAGSSLRAGRPHAQQLLHVARKRAFDQHDGSPRQGGKGPGSAGKR